MKRSALLCLILSLGCNQPEKQESTESTEPKSVNIPDDFDFKNWPKAIEKPYHVSANAMVACAAWTYDPDAEGKRVHGPHYKATIMVRTNSDVIEAFKTHKPMPVGSVIVKEKLDNDAKLTSYGVMIKSEAGYDPDHGDWEYMYVDLQPERKVTRGKLESCINCHMNVKEKDCLFRSYLKPQ